MSVTRKRQFPFTVTIDDQPVRVLLKRLTVEEFEEFQAQFIANGERRGSPITMMPPTRDKRTPARRGDTRGRDRAPNTRRGRA
jgi:hypothetical protein